MLTTLRTLGARLLAGLRRFVPFLGPGPRKPPPPPQ